MEYLDRKTTLIDSLIEKTVRKIELLKEKRTSLINEVVTKGLNPDVEMKDSGVEWIGEIPSHWGVIPYKRMITILSDFESNGSFQTVKENVNVLEGEGATWYVRMTDLENGNLRNESCRYCDESSYHFLSKTQLFGGEILISKRGEIGKTYLFPLNQGQSTLGPNLYLTRPDQRVVSSEYLKFYFEADSGRIGLVLRDNSTTIGALYKDDLKSVEVALPPIHEQEQIVEYLDKQASIIESTITTEEKRIELLKEYRQSLISEVVTGKVNVLSKSK